MKCCEGEEGDDGDRKQVYTYFGKRFAWKKFGLSYSRRLELEHWSAAANSGSDAADGMQ